MLRSILMAGFLAAGLSAGPVLAEVTVEFVEPQRYTDIGDQRADHERNMALLESFFVDSVSGCLSEGEKLKVVVRNVDLAGLYDNWQPGPGVRKMRDIDLPRIEIEYTHHGADGSVKAEREEKISDINYLQRGITRRGSDASKPLRYEKEMIEHWADKNFCNDS